ncbi:MAG: ATP-binding protein [candidate division KSB1 bacterium]|nr:ATP-binding protein [candidate division KSB1 bacterium]
MSNNSQNQSYLLLIIILIIVITLLHYRTPTSKLEFHLVYMQAYFIPILLAAFRFGKLGGLGSAVIVSLLYLPHIMLHWGGVSGDNVMRFSQVLLFNAIGYLTGLKSQGEQRQRTMAESAAQKLEQSLQDLERRSEELLETQQQLQAADRLATIGELTASLAHEVRNPLGSIRGAVEIIRNEVPEKVRQLEFFDILIQDTKRLNQVVENYLSFAKPHSSEYETFDLVDILNNIGIMIGARTRKHNISLHIDTGHNPAPLLVHSDANLVWQAVMNVTLNAVDASPEDGRVSLKVEPADAGRIRLSVTDQGRGIPQIHLPQVFESFFTTKPDGSGLGLAIVKRLADQNNWEIRVNSEPERGTEFIFYFPGPG